MRTVLSSLILAAGLATAASAQEPAQQPAPAPGAEQPAAAPADQAQPAPAAPQASEPAAPAPAAAAPPPALPTTGDGAALISILERVCVPAVRGQGEFADLAKAAGMKQNRRDMTWAVGLGGNRAYQIVLFPPGANKDSCFGEVRYAHGQGEVLTQALNVWAFLKELDPTANYTQPQDPDGLKRVRRSWEKLSSDKSIGVNISTVKNPDGSPVNRRYDLATFQYQERTL